MDISWSWSWLLLACCVSVLAFVCGWIAGAHGSDNAGWRLANAYVARIHELERECAVSRASAVADGARIRELETQRAARPPEDEQLGSSPSPTAARHRARRVRRAMDATSDAASDATSGVAPSYAPVPPGAELRHVFLFTDRTPVLDDVRALLATAAIALDGAAGIQGARDAIQRAIARLDAPDSGVDVSDT